MDYDAARAYLLAKPEAEETWPFGPDVMVPKVSGKMFATLGVHEGRPQINLKCDPDQAVELRDIFDAVKPGYHMNKKHWNTVILDGSIPKGEIERMMDHSYALIVRSLKKADRLRLERNHEAAALYRDTLPSG